MDVSVIIVTRNTRAMTCAATRSVLDTDDSFAKEIIVVDNGSDDDTATALSLEFPIVKIIRSEFLVDAESISKVDGLPFHTEQLERELLERM